MAFASSVPWSGHSLHRSSVESISCAATSQTVKLNAIEIRPRVGRRIGFITLISSLVFAATSNRGASGFDFRLVAPDQTVEEAEGMIRGHARGLLNVKSLLELEDWREAQRELRRNAGFLKQDIYTIIQGKEGSIRPMLRKLYFDLFSNVGKLDYAARDKNVEQVWEYYNNMAAVLNDIFSRI